MGTSVPSAIGAAYADSDRPAVTVTGDGSLLMCVQELHTAAVEDVPVTTVVLNNRDYAIISSGTEGGFEFPSGAYGWAEEGAISYVALAESLGVEATFVESIDEVRGPAAGPSPGRNGEVM